MIAAVQDRNGVTHAVVLPPDHGLAGCTACNVRFWTGQLARGSVFVYGGDIRRDERMADVEADVDCMSCLVGLPVYDEACTDESPPTNETA